MKLASVANYVHRACSTLSCRIWPQKRPAWNLNSTIWQKAETGVSIGADCSWKWYFRDLDLPSSLCFKGVLKRWFSAQFSLVFFYSCSLLHLPVFCVSSVYHTLFVTAVLKNWVTTGFILHSSSRQMILLYFFGFVCLIAPESFRSISCFSWPASCSQKNKCCIIICSSVK